MITGHSVPDCPQCPRRLRTCSRCLRPAQGPGRLRTRWHASPPGGHRRKTHDKGKSLGDVQRHGNVSPPGNAVPAPCSPTSCTHTGGSTQDVTPELSSAIRTQQEHSASPLPPLQCPCRVGCPSSQGVQARSDRRGATLKSLFCKNRGESSPERETDSPEIPQQNAGSFGSTALGTRPCPALGRAPAVTARSLRLSSEVQRHGPHGSPETQGPGGSGVVCPLCVQPAS